MGILEWIKQTVIEKPLESIAVVLSGIAIIVSIAAERHTRKQNKTNLKSTYFLQLYKKLMFTGLPENRARLTYNSKGRLHNFSLLHETLQNIIQASQAYSFIDKRYYNKLKKSCQNLEDYLLHLANTSLPPSKRKKANALIDKKLKKIYRTMNKKYENG